MVRNVPQCMLLQQWMGTILFPLLRSFFEKKWKVISKKFLWYIWFTFGSVTKLVFMSDGHFNTLRPYQNRLNTCWWLYFDSQIGIHHYLENLGNFSKNVQRIFFYWWNDFWCRTDEIKLKKKYFFGQYWISISNLNLDVCFFG